MPARTSQSKTQHTAVTRRKKRALPQIAASRHCSTVSALAYRILRNGPASGGGGPPLSAKKSVNLVHRDVWTNSQRYIRPFWYEYGQSQRRNVVIGKGPYLSAPGFLRGAAPA
jgi:hypothetical protein|tara:strand:+ start:1145 stop:1483 length:339 start_codon:yes stop_codon:yes gene_type:complete